MASREQISKKLARHGLRRVNRAQRLNDGSGKSHHVVVHHNGVLKYLKFGQKGVKTNQSPEQRKAFKSRHAKNIARGPLSPAWWANKVKWPSK